MSAKMVRGIAAAAVALVSWIAITMVTASPASAVQQDVTCVGTATETFTPGLTYTPQTITYTTNLIYSPCTSSDATLTSAVSGSTSTVPNSSCNMLPFAGSGSFVLTWNNGNTSTFTFNAVSTIVAGQVVLTRTGTITAGQFQGDTAIRVVTYPTVNPLDCLTTGVTSQFGAVTLSITAP
ncbi:hypothetical protein EV385_1208 [Krasilnikovia cinnamomea]|uniref:Ig-like domain-containing protein n=1 Tax=Krasilnikovia cinnamomea TaxID=349313 RepID=A0A4Q7ZFG0_9ACTN|nr:hypothetical protein [Krasilnikovia cinnamomea]RZU49458.1 hypothetical protein EV385_1208 [Krasilnikovia cinnamomea]